VIWSESLRWAFVAEDRWRICEVKCLDAVDLPEPVRPLLVSACSGVGVLVERCCGNGATCLVKLHNVLIDHGLCLLSPRHQQPHPSRKLVDARLEA